ncbi:MAG: HAMP domain-containing protein [Bacteroidetes bacterium]|nr:HAMP domain-containing protein [Bacteroidota bacterium]
MKKSISIKLAFVIGILLILTLVVGLMAFFQTRYVNDKIKQIADIDHNTSVTAYQMEINIVGTSFAVLRYLHEHDTTLLVTIEKEEKDFNIFQNNYREILQTPKIKKLGQEVEKSHSEFIHLSKVLISMENQQSEKIEMLQGNLAELNRFLEEKIQDSIKKLDLNKYRKLKAALKMQVNANHINRNLENYLRTHQERFKDGIIQNQKDFRTNFGSYMRYTHSDRKQQLLATARNKFNETVELSKAIMNVELIKEESLLQFELTQKQLVVLLERQILILAQRNLIKAKEDALDASRNSMSVITIILIAGLLFGSIMSVIFARHISRPLKQLVQITNLVAKGDFSQKVRVASEDELGILGRSFNLMIDELDRIKQQQAKLLLKLEKSNNELNDFAYVVSHDLKAPLRAISTISDWVVTDYIDKLDQNGIDQLHLLKDRVKRMQDLIDGILKYSRIGRQEEEKEIIDIRQLLIDTLQLINKPDNIEINILDGFPTLSCQRVRIQQVFLNLIENAVKYMDKPKGIINVKCKEERDQYVFSVSDNGPGIEEKYFEKIFQMFQTLRPIDEKESTGIGLTIVKKIIENAGGKIWVESEIGKGSTFYFTIVK